MGFLAMIIFYKRMIFLFSLILALLVSLASCATNIDGLVREDGSAAITLQTSLEPRTIALVRSIRGFLGETTDAPILDGAAISRSITEAAGVSSAALTNTSPTALAGSIALANVDDFLAAAGTAEQFINFTSGAAPGSSSIVITLDRNTALALIANLSPELAEYLSVLMAPVITGENITRQHYLNLLAMVYGRALSDEIAAARVHASIQFPRTITTIHGGTAAGNRAEFDIPLVDLMVLEHPLRYEIRW